MKYSVTIILIFINFLSCTQKSVIEKSSLFESLNCVQANEDLRNPTTYNGVINLINSLPKPLTVNCFLFNFDPPYDIYAVNSSFSAQPADGNRSPRILIIRDDFILSFVPSGEAKHLVEFGKVTENNRSIKGEIHFPVNNNLLEDGAFSSIIEEGSSPARTSCRFCHGGETQHSNGGIESDIVAPDSLLRVESHFLSNEAETCLESEDSFRCNMLRLIYKRGEAKDVDWPF